MLKANLTETNKIEKKKRSNQLRETKTKKTKIKRTEKLQTGKSTTNYFLKNYIRKYLIRTFQNLEENISTPAAFLRLFLTLYAPNRVKPSADPKIITQITERRTKRHRANRCLQNSVGQCFFFVVRRR